MFHYTTFRTYEAAPQLSAVQEYPQAKKLQERDTKCEHSHHACSQKTHVHPRHRYLERPWKDTQQTGTLVKGGKEPNF